METPFLQGTHRLSHAQVPGQSKVTIGMWVRPDCRSWRTSWENRGECGLLWGKDTEGKALGNIQQLPFSGGGHLGKIWPHMSVSAEKPQAIPGGITALPLSKQAA